MYMDEVISKWGFGSGISLFIAAEVSLQIVVRALSPLPSPTNPEVMTGAIPALFQSLSRGEPQTAALMLAALVSTIAVFVLATYAQSMKVEIPLFWKSEIDWHQMAFIIYVHLKHPSHPSCCVASQYPTMGTIIAELGTPNTWIVHRRITHIRLCGIYLQPGPSAEDNHKRWPSRMDDMGAGFGPHIVHGGRIDNILVVLGADIRDGRSITSKNR